MCYCSEKTTQGLFALSIFLFGGLTILYLILHLPYGPLPEISGDVEAKYSISDYGFGPRKQLLIFDITEIGSVENIDLSDKKFATVSWSDIDNNGTFTPIGIEIKGSGLDERRKINYAFEFWEPANSSIPCTSIETCDDDKAEIFQFGEKYEDYVLRGGYWEPTLTRDVIATKLKGGILQTTLVEVLLRIGDKYTYEGVYTLFPAIQRRVLEKHFDWDNNGKKADCADIADPVAFIMEFTIESGSGRKAPCSFLDNVKMRYPNCDFYDEVDIAPCRAEYIEKTKAFSDILTMENTTFVNVSMLSFVQRYYAAILLRESDFPFTSQYFYTNPDTDELYAGPRWDHDDVFWRVCPDSWDLYDLFKYSREPMDFWVHLGQHKPFIDYVKQEKATIDYNEEKALEVIDERMEQVDANYFERNTERWNVAGRKLMPNTDSLLQTIYGVGVVPLRTMKKDLTFSREKIVERSEWMRYNIDSFTEYKVQQFYLVWLVILQCTPWLASFILFLVMLGYMICPPKKGSDTNNVPNNVPERGRLIVRI